jgi:hypothetical protein
VAAIAEQWVERNLREVFCWLDYLFPKVKILEATMRRSMSLLLILVFVQTAVSLAEQDAIVSDVMKGSRTIGGQTIEYPEN